MFIPLQNSSDWLPEISNSLRFDGSNDYLYRVPNANATNQNIGTISMWIKRSKLGVAQNLLDCYVNTSVRTGFYFFADDTLQIAYSNAGVAILTANKFRDPSAWYHLVYQHNIGLPRLWINGVEAAYTTQTNLGTYACALGYNAAAFGIGAAFNGTTPFEGYIANVCVVVGQSKAPTDFAYTDPKGQWRSLKKSDLQTLATAGDNNSFFLSFDDGTSTTTLGTDASSKGNNWTLTNMVRTGGTDDCWSYDTPTNNFATLNPLYYANVSGGTSFLSNGNLTNGSPAGTNWYCARTSTITVSSGKWYYETLVGLAQGSSYPNSRIGFYVVSNSATLSSLNAAMTTNPAGSTIEKNSAAQTNVAGITTNDVVGVALDLDNLTCSFYKNGTLLGTVTGLTAGEYQASNFAVTNESGLGTNYVLNFGQRPVASGQWYPDAGGYFRYAPPTDYKALSTKNLPTPSIIKPNEQFDVKLDTGANIKTTTEAVYPSNFFEWIKDRANSNNHQLIDSVRGSSAVLQSNTTAVETTYTAPSGTSVGWVWKAGGAAVSNTAGTITSQVSANPTAGFSIVTYTGTGANATVGHGLGVAPKMVIVKQRTPSGTSWTVWNKSVFDTSAAGVVYLESNVGYTNVASAFNSTAPTSTVFSVGNGGGSSATNISTNTYVAYCFAEVPGFSKIGSYTGNGSTDGPFVWCGFRPKYVLIKRSDASGEWVIFDSARATYNVNDTVLFAHLANVEQGPAAGYGIDFTANGFKVRSASNNVNGGTLIFMAFAEAPFKYANAR